MMAPTRAEREAADKVAAAQEIQGVGVTWTEFGDRKISKKDFASKGIDSESLEWTKDNSHTVVVPNAVAEYLLAEETGFQLTSKLRKAKLEELDIDLQAESTTLPAGGSGGDGVGSGPASTGSTGGTTV
jgi:hypothetical protein